MAKYRLIYSNSYKKDAKKLSAQILAQIEAVLDRLANGEKLEPKYHDHALKGGLKGLRDCHVRPDLVLIYQIDGDELILTALRIGSHSELGLK